MPPTALVRVFPFLCLALLGGASVAAAQADWTRPADQREDSAIPNPGGGAAGFGATVAIDGDTLVVGAPYFYGAGVQHGMVSIYARSGGTWVLQQSFEGSSGLGFGGAVDVSGDTVIAGSLDYSGAPVGARVYVRSGGTWTPQATLVPDGVSSPGTPIVAAVAIDGNTAVVANQAGAAYVFVRSGTTWTQQAKLTPEQAGVTRVRDRSVAIEGNTVVVGAPYTTVGANAHQGAALVFVRSGTTWTPQAVLTSAASRAGSWFGRTVVLSGDTVLCIDGGSSVTRAYRFTRAGGAWSEQTPLVPPEGTLPPQMISLALDGGTAVLGSEFSPFVFRRVGAQWVYQDRLRSGHNNDWISERLGHAVAVSGSTVLVGAPDYGRGEETNGPGRAYVYSLPSGPPAAPTLTGSATGTTVSLSWTPPAGAAPSSYIVEAGTAPGLSNVYAGSVGNTLGLSTVAPPATYHVRVRGVNAFGPGAPSNEIALTVGTPPGPLPGAPTLTGSVAQSIVSLAWKPAAAGGPPTSYVLEAGTAPGAANLYNANVGAGTALSATVTPATYYIRVRGANAAGIGPASNEVALTATGCTLPAIPTGLSFSLAGNVVTVFWNQAPGAVAYFLEAGSAPGAKNIVNASMGGALSVSTLAPPGTYYVRVRSANPCGISLPTPDVTIVVP